MNEMTTMTNERFEAALTRAVDRAAVLLGVEWRWAGPWRDIDAPVLAAPDGSEPRLMAAADLLDTADRAERRGVRRIFRLS